MIRLYRMTKHQQGINMLDMNTVLTLIGTIVFGSLAGAVLTVWHNGRSEKKQSHF